METLLVNIFFKLVQAKRIRESICILKTTDGKITKDEDEILRGVFNHRRSLYSKDHQVDIYREQRDEVLSLIDKRFFDEDNQELKAVPNKYEITRVVFSFPTSKSSGGDGVTYNFLQCSWDLVGECYVMMVQEFCKGARLSKNIVNGIVKMIPQNFEELEVLDNW